MLDPNTRVYLAWLGGFLLGVSVGFFITKYLLLPNWPQL